MTLPFLIEATGLLGSTWEVTSDGLLTHGTTFQHTAMMLIMGNAVIVMLIGGFALGIARDRRKAQRDRDVQAWHLEQLLPKHER